MNMPKPTLLAIVLRATVLLSEYHSSNKANKTVFSNKFPLTRVLFDRDRAAPTSPPENLFRINSFSSEKYAIKPMLFSRSALSSKMLLVEFHSSSMPTLISYAVFCLKKKKQNRMIREQTRQLRDHMSP